MGRKRSVRAAIVGLLLALLWAPTSAAIPGSGPHVTVDITATTTQPNASTGLNWQATFRNAEDPAADPPALRRIVIVGPRGLRSDTSVTAQCAASDDELRQQGEAACPPDSRIGSGTATARMFGVLTNTFDTTVFNAERAQIELIQFMGRGAGVRRGEIRGRTIDAEVPTCIRGGQPPDGCPFDQVVVLSNELHQEPISVGEGRNRRNLLTTPRRCPRSGLWQTRVTFYFGDGSVDNVVTKQPCADG